MKPKRFLLPFTQGVDVSAVEHAVSFAEQHHADLLAVALLYAPDETPSRGLRLEHIQQSKDFLVFVQRKALARSVHVEQLEIVTHDVVQSVNSLALEGACEGILLFWRAHTALLLAPHEAYELTEHPVHTLYTIHLPVSGKKHVDVQR